MSDNIIIQKKGVAQVLTNISELETSKQGGGSETWVPEEERVLIKKTITKKGKYKASADGAYGYSEVVVKLSKSSAADKPKEEEYKPASPTITIQEGGVGKVLSGIKKINVARQDGTTSSWIPEENVALTTLTAHGNGTFKAKNMGYYGFSEVTASQKVKVVTKDDGNEYAQWDDGEEKIPSSIMITTPPDKTTYITAEPIDTTGMVVTAYYGDGTEWGVVPSDEIEIEPLVAISGSGNTGTVPSDNPLNVPSFDFAPYSGEIKTTTTDTFYTNCMYTYCKSEYKLLAASDVASLGGNTSNHYDYDGKRVYYIHSYNYPLDGSHGSNIAIPLLPDIDTVVNHVDVSKAAWLMVYGGYPIGESEKVTVKWKREDDDKELTDEFGITVTPPPVPSI